MAAIFFFPALVIYLFEKRKITERVRAINDVLSSDLRLAERAKDMFLSSEYYRGRAVFNNIASLVTMAGLLAFVAFAGAFLNKDTVQFDAVQKFENLVEKLSAMQGNSAEKQAQLLRVSNNYSESLKKQVDAEASINEPYYRVVSGLMIRISAVAVAIYLVIILNKSYKYNNNVAAIYRARFIALMRGDEDFEHFAKYALLLSAETVDYNTDIEHPAERMLSIFDKIKETFKK